MKKQYWQEGDYPAVRVVLAISGRSNANLKTKYIFPTLSMLRIAVIVYFYP